MATAEHLRSIALSLPEATERPMHGTPALYVKTKFFTKLSNDGRTAVVHVDSLEEEALLAEESVKLTTTPHHDGYRMVLVVLAKVTKTELREFVTESWRRRAPRTLVTAFDTTQQ